MLLNDIEAETSRELFQFRKYFGQVKFVVETVKNWIRTRGGVYQPRALPWTPSKTRHPGLMEPDETGSRARVWWVFQTRLQADNHLDEARRPSWLRSH